MPRPRTREDALTRLKSTIAKGEPIVGAGAGIGLSAASTEAGGADLIIVYNSGRYRMAGRGSLASLMPYGNANDAVLSLTGEILPLVRHAPVLAGVCATDPFRDMDAFLQELKGRGFAGVQNFPTVGLIDGEFRRGLEESGMGFGHEVEMVRRARGMGLLTTPYVFDPGEARAMAEAGADVLVAHMGLTASGEVGAKTGKTLDQAGALIQEIEREARGVNEKVIVLCHGGPIATPKDAQYIMSWVKGVDGFCGASSLERLPVEEAITNMTREFKGLRKSGAAEKIKEDTEDPPGHDTEKHTEYNEDDRAWSRHSRASFTTNRSQKTNSSSWDFHGAF